MRVCYGCVGGSEAIVIFWDYFGINSFVSEYRLEFLGVMKIKR